METVWVWVGERRAYRCPAPPRQNPRSAPGPPAASPGLPPWRVSDTRARTHTRKHAHTHARAHTHIEQHSDEKKLLTLPVHVLNRSPKGKHLRARPLLTATQLSPSPSLSLSKPPCLLPQPEGSPMVSSRRRSAVSYRLMHSLPRSLSLSPPSPAAASRSSRPVCVSCVFSLSKCRYSAAVVSSPNSSIVCVSIDRVSFTTTARELSGTRVCAAVASKSNCEIKLSFTTNVRR
eukprot:COSAG03_NODE_5465_length_1244_cov_8.764192_1_plen_233_part_00